MIAYRILLFVGACVEDANMYRRRHPGTPMLTYDPQVTIDAQNWADILLNERDGNMEHANWDERKPEGENLAGKWLAPEERDTPIDKVAACKHANAMWWVENKCLFIHSLL